MSSCGCMDCMAISYCISSENEFLKDENKRLREALREVSHETLIYNGVSEFERIGDIARAALEQK